MISSGGGIGGLALALVLQTFAKDKQVKVNLYEAESDFKEVGAGISIWHRSRYILKQLGADDALNTKSVSPELMVRKSDVEEGVTFTKLDVSGV